MGLGTDLTLVAIDSVPGHLRVGPTLPYSLIVGELVDLAAAGRIVLCDGLIEVLDRLPIGDTLADDSLVRLADFGQRLSVEEWLERQGRWRVEAYLAGLRYEGVLRDSSVEVGGSGRIEIADTLRAAAPVQRLRALIAQESDALPVQDLAFLVLADSTGWPKAHLRLRRQRGHRARLKRLVALVEGPAEVAGFEGDAAFAVLRRGVRAVAKLARQSPVSDGHIVDYDVGSSRSSEPSGLMRPGLRLVTYIVALLALATLVLACLTNLGLAIIIAPFAIALMAMPIIDLAERRGRRRRSVRPGRGETDATG